MNLKRTIHTLRPGSLLVFLIAIIAGSPTWAANRKSDKPEVSFEVELAKKAYVGEAVTYNLYAYSSDKNIAQFQWKKAPNFRVMPYYEGEADQELKVVRKNGKEMYRFNVLRLFFVPDKAGKFEINATDAYIGIPHEVAVNDFFWGPMRRTEYERILLHVPGAEITVKNRPKAPDNFSGAVGEFSVISWLPPGKITVDRDAVGVVKLSGYGNLKNINVWDMSHWFGDSAIIIDSKRSEKLMQKDGRMYSELLIELTFEPKVKDGEFGPVDFVVFNPRKGKYETLKSQPESWSDSDVEISPSSSHLRTIGI